MRVYARKSGDESAFERMKRCEADLGGFVFGEDEQFQKDGKTQKYRVYYACDDPALYFERLRATKPMLRRAHETFNASLRCRLFLDFDCVGETPETVLQNISRAMEALGSSKYILVDGTRESKVSFHVVSHDLVLEDADAVGRYVESILDQDTRDAMGIDLAPCANWKSLRTIYSKGFDKSTWMRMHTKDPTDLSLADWLAAQVQTREPSNVVVPESVRSILVPFDDTMESLKDRARSVIQNYVLMRYESVKMKRASTFEGPNTAAFYVYKMPCPFQRDHVHHSNRILITCVLFDPSPRTDYTFAPEIKITVGCFNPACGENREKKTFDRDDVRWIQAMIYS